MRSFNVTVSSVKVVLSSAISGTFVKCEECGEYHALKTMEKVDSDYICNSCITHEYTLCWECNEYFKNDELYTAYDDGKRVVICNSCKDSDYYYCEDCDTLNKSDDIIWVNPETRHEKSVCDSCISDYYKCDDCGEYFSNVRGYGDDFGNFVCDSCYDEFYRTCDDCGRIISIDDCYCDDDGYEIFCESCYTENNTQKLINSYDYKPEPEFYCTENEQKNDSTLFMGCELEVDNGNDKTSGAESVKLHLENHVYNKNDGSLNNGFEIVTHPMSLAYHTSLKSSYANTFSELSAQGFKSHDTSTCGYHIHVGREFLGDTWQETDYTIGKIALLIELHWDKLLIFSRRKSEEIRWCKKFQVTESVEDITDIEKINCKCKKQYDRYFALNLQNNNTIEFRLFKGTLKLDTYFACMQLVSNIVNVAKNTSIADLVGLTFYDIVSYENYSELTEYCKAKGLIEA